MKKYVYLVAAGALALSAAPASLGQAENARFTLSSPAVKDGAYMPKKYAGKNPQSPNCDGDNVALPLVWKNAPANAKSFAITMVDPVPRGGAGFVHWVAYGIPASKTGFNAGEANNAMGFVSGKNGAGNQGWLGPCPPLADAAHPYTIVLIATDLAPDALQPGLSRDELIAALNGHALGATSFVARYRKP